MALSSKCKNYPLHAWQDNRIRLKATQGEGGIKIAQFTLLDDNGAINLSSATSVTFDGIKRNGQGCCINCKIVDATNGIIEFVEQTGITDIDGNVNGTINVVSADGNIKFDGITLYVAPNNTTKLIEASQAFSAFVEALNKLALITPEGTIAIDDVLTDEGVNAVQGKVIKAAIDSKLDNTAGSVTTDKLAETVKNDISSKASLMALAETGYLQLKDINNNVLSSVKLPTSAPSAIRAELKNLIDEGAISGIATGVYNVMDFGAVGDGVTDDTAAFVNCINNANGRPVFVPPGTYVVNYAFCGDGKAIYLLGIGNPTIIRTITPDGNDNAPMFKFNNAPSAYINGITFNSCRDDFLVTATTTKDIDGHTIDATDYEEWVDTACLYFYRNGKNILIENCTFTNCSREGIYFTQGEYADIIVRNNKFKDTSACLWANNGVFENIVFEDNYCDGNRTMPIEFDNTTYNGVKSVVKNAVVRNNKFLNVCKCAVQFRAIDGLTIENNEYSNRGQLYEHGRKSSDNLDSTFIWGLANLSDADTLVAQNINIKNNKGEADTVVKLQANINSTGNVSQFDNVKITDNDFAVKSDYVIARCTDNLKIANNAMSGEDKSILLRATSVRNVLIDKNRVINGANLYYEETIGTEGCMIGDGEKIKMINNSANLVANPFVLTSNSYSSNSKIAFDLENNALNTWDLIGENYYDRSGFYSKSRLNVNTSGVTTAALGTSTNDKYQLRLNSAVDLQKLDTSGATLTDGYVVLRVVKTFTFAGRQIKLIVSGQAVKTDATATDTGKILNEITVPDGGILTLIYTGSGWYAS